MEQVERRLSAQFQDEVITSEMHSKNHVIVTIKKDGLRTVCQQVMEEAEARFVTMVGTDERGMINAFGLYYVFAIDSLHGLITVHTHVKETEPTFPSVTKDLPVLNWYEREVHDLFGLKPSGHPQLQPLMLHRDWPEGNYPLRKDYPLNKQQQPERSEQWFDTEYEGEGITKVPVGPIHAGIIEPGHFLFGVAGDAILNLDAQLFFKHRGVEKKAESMTIDKGLFLAERICGACAMSHAISYSLAVESIAEVTVPRRAQMLRMVFLELERLSNHIGDIGDICSGAAFHIGTSHGARLKEELQQLYEQIAGHRFLRGIVTLGGVRQDLASHEIDFLLSRLAEIRRDFRELVNIILDHEITLDRMATTGRLSKETADLLEVVGPAGRASGRPIDVRKTHPYLLYDEMDMIPPIYEQGDVLARVHVRIDEVFHSFSMIHTLLNDLADGPIVVEIPKLEPYQWGIGLSESALGENVHWLMTGENGEIYRYRVRSAAYSNWPAVPSAIPGNIVPDFPIINKSFELCYACCDR